MARYRSFLYPGSEKGEGFLLLEPRESHHLVRVFRAKLGETVEVLDGKGRRYQGRLEVANAKAARITIDAMEELPSSMPEVTLVQAVPKGKAMDLVLRMATEIGASRIQPVFTEQGEVQIKGERLVTKVEKWRVTMIEACKQCGLAWLPELSNPVSLQQWLERTGSDDCLRVVASLESGSRPLAEALSAAGGIKKVEVAVGPEGDFSLAEYRQLGASGYQPVRLGANVLRAETATAYILSVVDQLSNL